MSKPITLPKVEFRYSWYYDSIFKEHPSIKRLLKKEGKAYPSPKHISKFIKDIQKAWNKESKRILNTLSQISGLSWKQDEIVCYIVGCSRSFSDPFTMGVMYNEKIDTFMDDFTHELIHNLFVSGNNYHLSTKSWEYFHRKYKNNSFNTIVHIPLEAIHAKLILQLYGQRRLDQEIKHLRQFDEYKRAWTLVEEKGYEEILREFKERMR